MWLHIGIAWETLKNTDVWVHPLPRETHLIGPGHSLDFSVAKNSPGDSNVQPGLGATDFILPLKVWPTH